MQDWCHFRKQSHDLSVNRHWGFRMWTERVIVASQCFVISQEQIGVVFNPEICESESICVSHFTLLLCFPFLIWKKNGGLVREGLLQNKTLQKWNHQLSMKQSSFTQTPFSHKKYRVHLFVQKIHGFAICGAEYESSCLYYDDYFF